MKPFSQEAWACRCEWGERGVDALAPADVTIVVDVFSFTTCVDIAVSRGALRNARAVAHAAHHLGSTFNIIPAGERWHDGSLRPALEDWLGAGAILRALPGTRSPEAESAIALFERYRDRLVEILDQCGSGRELDGRGHEKDKFIAGQLDVSSSVARFDGIAFVAA